jgi:branched-chain amino acid transport system substrate-binding protein
MAKKVWTWLVPLIVVIIILAIIVIWYGVSKKPTNPTAKEPIKIGVISPLTGSASNYGDPAAKAIVLAAEQINKQGGINGRRIELIIEDGKCDATEAVNAVNKLINVDKVKIILGGHCSTESLAIAPIVNEKKVLQLASITSSDKYTQAGDYSFRNWPTSDYYVGKLGELAYTKYNARQTAIIYEQKDFPLSVSESFKKTFTKEGGKIVIEQSFPSTETDFRSYLLKVKYKKDVDSILFISQGENTMINFFKQMQEMGLLGKYKLFTNNVGVSQKVFQETGGLNKNVITTDVYVYPENPKTKNFLEAYRLKYGSYPQTNYFYVASSYDGLMLIVDAFKSCNYAEDVECIKNFLYNIKNWEGASGKISFDSNGDAITQIAVHYYNDEGNEIWEEVE